MNTLIALPRRDRCCAVAMLLAITLSVMFGGHPLRARADDGRDILRLDPIRDQLVAISAEEIKQGHIYSHFSTRLNRRVWSYVQSDGTFWYALGEGTTQAGWRFDIRATMVQRRERLAQVDRELARKIGRDGGDVYLRLRANDEWDLVSTATHATIYNRETARRWEWVNGRYVPVVNASGYRWHVRSGRYVPGGY